MDYILLDTCIVLHILRGKDYSERSKEAIHNFSHAPAFVMSVITAGELEAMKVFQDWGDKRINALKSFLEGVTFIDITHSDEELLAAYARIDAYSKQKMPDRNGHLMPGSHKAMHKNDLWIAATALVLDIPLITSDSDFDHLNNTLLQVSSRIEGTQTIMDEALLEEDQGQIYKLTQLRDTLLPKLRSGQISTRS